MKELYQQIVALAEEIEVDWQKQNYSSDVFHELVWGKTGDIDLAPLGDVVNQLNLIEHAPVRSLQRQNTFSDLYVQVFNNGRFYIEILNWWGGQVNAHDHDFSGVQFQLRGDALNLIIDFERDESIGALTFGSLNFRSAEIWKQGDRSIVRAGTIDPHYVFHLGEPTTSLIIRTQATQRYGAQSNYFHKVCGHYYVSTEYQRKKLTALALLSRNRSTDFAKSLARCIETQSLSENLFMLVKLGSCAFIPETSKLLADFANTGRKEYQVLEAAIENTAADGLRDFGVHTKNTTQMERLAMFVSAACRSVDQFLWIEAELKVKHPSVDLIPALNSLIGRVEPIRSQMVLRHLNVLGQADLVSMRKSTEVRELRSQIAA